MRIRVSRTPLLILAGCAIATPTPLDAAVVRPAAKLEVTCQAGPDCNGKWTRASVWVANHSDFNIEISSDSIIKTVGPLPHDARPAFTVTKFAYADGVYHISLAARCERGPDCATTLDASGASFATFVNAASTLGEIAHQGKPIGVQLIPVTPSSDPSLKHGSERGMIVDSVTEGGVAEDVGIRGGDVLMAIDSKAVNTEEDVKAALNAAAPHHTAKMHLLRGGKNRVVTVLF
jgi:hypothetical protein